MMLGHYCLFLTGVNKWVVFYICIVFAKLNGIMMEHVGHRFDTAPALLMAWLCTKYQYYFPSFLLAYTAGIIINPIGQFYNLIMMGQY